MPQPFLLAGIPVTNQALYHRIRFAVGDSAAYISLPSGNMLLVRDIEMSRARRIANADQVGCAADFAPAGGLSGDRDTALAQATAEYVRRSGVSQISSDRTLPFIFAWHLQQVGVEVVYDADLGVLQRRVKDEQELQHLRAAQAMTENAMRMACETICRADVDAQGQLLHKGEVLTSERLRSIISIYLMERNYSNHHDSIVASIPHVADCHNFGTGPLRTGETVVVDIFPCDNATRYWGDCTRTAVHGAPRPEVLKMHAAVAEAKQAGVDALRAGSTGQAVHEATTEVIRRHGFHVGPRTEEMADDVAAMPHGTGHGVGLEVHEPILLDKGGGELLVGEVLTVEPGLYSPALGGVRLEDMVAVTTGAAENFNRLPEGLDWS